jgi:nitroimidazol reductase NimA-like FMN-containing flavoprotein (pyridoxamine 5'-phosphate oxidase superfamily)
MLVGAEDPVHDTQLEELIMASDSPSAKDSRVRELTQAECIERLTTHEIGRLGFDAGDGIAVLPVNYLYWSGRIAFRTSADGMLATLATRSSAAFEIDEFDMVAGTAWSVLVRGFTRHIRSAMPMVELLNNPQLSPWMPGPRRLIIAIEPTSISGRRLTAS